MRINNHLTIIGTDAVSSVPLAATGSHVNVAKQHSRPSAVGGNAKRVFDFVIAFGAILALLPLLVGVIAYLRLSGKGPIFFGQRRQGLGGSTFTCWKFRTMVVDAEKVLAQHLRDHPAAAVEWHRSQKLKNDPRIIPGGHMLRKSSLDELPQLWNVLVGEMSIVGPRPIVSAEVSRYRRNYRHYILAKPGLTGLWQISGRNNVSYDTRIAYDRRYVTSWSLLRDCAIVVMTVPAVLAQRGSS